MGDAEAGAAPGPASTGLERVWTSERRDCSQDRLRVYNGSLICGRQGDVGRNVSLFMLRRPRVCSLVRSLNAEASVSIRAALAVKGRRAVGGSKPRPPVPAGASL